jgi:serine/threonine-protein kinase
METDLKVRAQTFEDVLAMIRQAMPDLERSSVRLPTPLIVSAGEPSVNKSLSGSQASDRPQPFIPHVGDTLLGVAPPIGSSGKISVVPPPHGSSDAWPAAHPSSAPSGSSWQTPNTSYASIMSPPPKRSSAWLAIATTAALVVSGIGIGAVIAARHRAEPALAAAGTGDTARAPAPAFDPNSGPASTTGRPGEPAAVSVDSLPGAKSVTTTPSAKGTGRLSIAASPGGCTITIDGKDHGATPVASVDLAAGSHQIVCKPANGKQRSASVTIQDGASSKYRFALDD